MSKQQWTPPSTDIAVSDNVQWQPPSTDVELKKKAGTPAVPNGSKPSVNGPQPSPPSPQNTELSNQLNSALKAYQAHLTPDEQKDYSKVQEAIQNRQPDRIRATTKDEQDAQHAMDSTLGKVTKSLTYLGSKASKGTVQVAKGGAWVYNHMNTALEDTESKGQKEFWDKVDKFTDLGITKGQEQQIEGGKGLLPGLVKTGGMMAEFAPALAGGEYTQLPKTFFALQGLGQGKETIDAADPDKKLHPLVRDAFVLGSGAVNGILMGDLGENVFGKMPAGLRKNIVTDIVANAMKDGAGKELTDEGFKRLLNNGAKDFAEKFQRFGVSALSKYNKSVVDLSALNAANFALKKGVDVTTDKPVFNESSGDLAHSIEDVVTKQAPLFAAIGAVPEATKLLPYSNFKNDIVEHVMNNPNDAEAIKAKMADLGQQSGWTPEEVQATNQHVDQIADAAKKLPDNIKPEKKADAVQLLLDKDKLQGELTKEQSKREGFDESVKDIPSKQEEYLTNKVDQANDKLRTLVTGKPTTYSKGIGEEDGLFFKTTDGKKEEITENRYNLENLERTTKNQQNESNENAQKGNEESSQGGEKGQSSQEENGQGKEDVLTTGAENAPLNTENDEGFGPIVSEKRNGINYDGRTISVDPITREKLPFGKGFAFGDVSKDSFRNTGFRDILKEKLKKHGVIYTLTGASDDVLRVAKKIIGDDVEAKEFKVGDNTYTALIDKKIAEQRKGESKNAIQEQSREEQQKETDEKIKEFQKNFPDHHVDVLEDLPEHVVRTFDRVDADLPTDPVAINEASDWLYNKYKELTKMKLSDTRMLTIPQIEAMQEQLGQDIAALENHKLKYHGEADETQPETSANTSTVSESDKTEIRKEITPVGEFSPIHFSPKEHQEANDLLAEHGITIKDIEDEQQERNAGSEEPAPATTDEKGIQQPPDDGAGNAGKTGPGEAPQSEEGKNKPVAIRNEGAEKGGTDVKKTILTQRAYEGTISEDVKKHLEEKGLTRKSFSQEERSSQATNFINKFGDDAAYQAIKAGDIDGGLAASILAQLQIKNSAEMAGLPKGAERDALAKKQADYIDLAEQKGYLGGEFNGQLAFEYQNAELNYANVKKQVEKLTNKPLTQEQETKIKNITSENEKLKNQLQQAEAKLIDETDKAFKAGEEAAKNETKAEKAKRIADKLRKNAKLQRPGVFSAATPASLVWDAAIEVTAKSIEAGGKIADAIEEGIKHIKGTDWYKSLSDNKKKLAEDEFKRANNDHAGSTDLADLQARFVDKADNKFSPFEARDIWGYVKAAYLDNGASYRDAVSKTAADLGLSWRQISEAITTPKVKRMSDEMWKRQADYARNRAAIKNWIGDQNKSAAGKLLQKISGMFRGVAVFGHGGIFVGTHAGMTLFNPSMWNKTIPAFFRGWRFAYGNEGNYERSIEELKNSQNYVLAQRAGLKNNPERINTEEYQKSQKYLGKLGLAGEKGFNAIKVLRQDLFDHHFNKLSPDERDDPAVAKSIAHIVNLATGATNLNIPAWVNEASFAGGMEAARWEKLTASPAKATQVALNSIFNPSKATTADRVFAKVWARRVGEQLATYTGALLANSAIQNNLNPKNPVNITNPNAPDFLKFKFGDMTIDPTSGMRSTAMFMRTLGMIPFESKQELHGDKRIAALGKGVAGYVRGKLAPLYGTGADFFTGTDFSGNVMPYSGDKPGKGKHKLDWLEYGSSKLPLPVAEAFTVYYKSALEHGADKSTLDDVINGIMSGAISGSTGFRVGEYGDKDAEKNKPKMKKAYEK